MRQCLGKTLSGKKCKRVQRSKYCHDHHPKQFNKQPYRVAHPVVSEKIQTQQSDIEWMLLLGRQLLDDCGLHKWRIKFNRSKKYYGSTYYDNCLITISKEFAIHCSETENLNTLTHEIAHALCPSGEHDSEWVSTHKAMGGDGEECGNTNVPDSFFKWNVICNDCKQICDRRHRRSKHFTKKYHCSDCEGSLKFVKIH